VAGYEPPFKIEPLGKQHDRAAFVCEREALTEYFQKTARQHVTNRMCAVFVLVERATGRVAGYYSLSMHSIEAGAVPPEIQKACKLPRRGDLPAALIGRLARDLAFKGQELGPLLAYDAINRVRHAREMVGCVAIVVDPEDEKARHFWINLGFKELQKQSRLFLPAGIIQQLP
jgi:ribosomal protein S18 acetylase RimI-like enzyme